LFRERDLTRSCILLYGENTIYITSKWIKIDIQIIRMSIQQVNSLININIFIDEFIQDHRNTPTSWKQSKMILEIQIKYINKVWIWTDLTTRDLVFPMPT
jgi:hypothetical protein